MSSRDHLDGTAFSGPLRWAESAAQDTGYPNGSARYGNQLNHSVGIRLKLENHLLVALRAETASICCYIQSRLCVPRILNSVQPSDSEQLVAYMLSSKSRCSNASLVMSSPLVLGVWACTSRFAAFAG